MARTKASACRKSSGGKAQRKAIASGSTPKSVSSSSSSKGSASIKKAKGSATLNGICQRATPEWQKKITVFMSTSSSSDGGSTSKLNDENMDAEDQNEQIELPPGNSKQFEDKMETAEEDTPTTENANEEKEEYLDENGEVGVQDENEESDKERTHCSEVNGEETIKDDVKSTRAVENANKEKEECLDENGDVDVHDENKESDKEMTCSEVNGEETIKDDVRSEVADEEEMAHESEVNGTDVTKDNQESIVSYEENKESCSAVNGEDSVDDDTENVASAEDSKRKEKEPVENDSELTCVNEGLEKSSNEKDITENSTGFKLTEGGLGDITTKHEKSTANIEIIADTKQQKDFPGTEIPEP